jgi:predicted nucleic acid-binding protein
MAKVTFDTNVFIKQKPVALPTGFFLSAIVIQELTAGALDVTRIKELDRLRSQFEKEGRLLVPNGEDWWQAGKILNSLSRGLKSRSASTAQKISSGEQQRIIRDVLIARTAKREGVAVVTFNIGDFQKISRYCKVRIIHPQAYFKSLR